MLVYLYHEGIMLASLFATYVKLFFILTPFFVISVFLVMTQNFDARLKRKIALRVTIAVLAISVSMYLFGQYIFAIFGITIDAFRVGAGSLLFLSAVTLVQGRVSQDSPGGKEDIAVVPLALPVTVGPGTVGILFVMGAEAHTVAEKGVDLVAIMLAVASLGFLINNAPRFEKFLGQRGLSILSKLTGLFVASIAAQLIMTGVRNFLA